MNAPRELIARFAGCATINTNRDKSQPTTGTLQSKNAIMLITAAMIAVASPSANRREYERTSEMNPVTVLYSPQPHDKPEKNIL